MKLVVNNPQALGIPRRRYDVDKDGTNASLLGRWLDCREKARLYLLGWAPRRIGSGRVLGVIIHGVNDEIYSAYQNGDLDCLPSPKRIRKEIARMEKRWKQSNPRADADTLQTLELQCAMAEAILPVYYQFWHKDLTHTDWMSLEHKFKVPLANTHLIGRMDGNFKPVKGRKVLWLFETKTKSRIADERKGQHNTLVDILPFELQTNLYLGAMVVLYGQDPGGLLMNVIRRPGLRLKKGEGPRAFAERVARDVRKRPEFYFHRIRMSVDHQDLLRIRKEHEALVQDFVQWAKGRGFHYRNSNQCENKYGTCEYLGICSRGDYTNMYQRKPRVRDVEEEL
jgi:hypothetical protein